MTADLSRIAEATDMRQLVEQAGVKLRIYRGVGTGCCPFHSEKTGSFRVNLSGKHVGKFRCHSCGVHGDCFDFVRKLEGLSLPDAVRRLAFDAGIPIDDKPETRDQAAKRIREKKEREIAEWYFRQEWKRARRGLNIAMAAGPVWTGTRWNLAGQLADFYGARLRWIEANRGTAAGLAEFRKSGVTEKQYREWLCGDLRRYAASLEFAELVLRG